MAIVYHIVSALCFWLVSNFGPSMEPNAKLWEPQTVQQWIDTRVSRQHAEGDSYDELNAFGRVYVLAVRLGIDKGECTDINGLWNEYITNALSYGFVAQSMGNVSDITVKVPSDLRSKYAGKVVTLSELLGAKTTSESIQIVVIKHPPIILPRAKELTAGFKTLCKGVTWK